MSARDEQPVTVPPPAGEDDAYSATTKVGAMPADLMEKLRAEGLLPEEAVAEDRATAVPRPSTSLDKRPTATATPAPSDGAPVPLLYSTAPPANEHASTKPPAPALTGPPAPLDSVETPVAFTKPTPSSLPPPRLPRDEDEVEAHGEAGQETTGLTRQKAAALGQPGAGRQPSPLMVYAIGALVVILLIVALIRLSR